MGDTVWVSVTYFILQGEFPNDSETTTILFLSRCDFLGSLCLITRKFRIDFLSYLRLKHICLVTTIYFRSKQIVRFLQGTVYFILYGDLQ